MFPQMTEAAGEVGTPQIRNVGTVGGNLNQRPRCWYFRNEEFPCLKKGAHAALPWTAKTSTTPSSATAPATSSIPRAWRCRP